MKPLYVITISGGEDEDSWTRPEYITDDLAKGEAYCSKMNEMRDIVDAAKKQVAEFSNQWKLDNPAPVVRPLRTVAIPKWDSKTKVTQEMFDERDKLVDANSRDAVDAYQPINRWNIDAYDAVLEFKKTLPEDVQNGIALNYDDAYWEIELVEWLA